MTVSINIAELADTLWKYDVGGGGLAGRQLALAEWSDDSTHAQLHVELLRCDLDQTSAEEDLPRSLEKAAAELNNPAQFVDLCRGFYEDAISMSRCPLWADFSNLGFQPELLQLKLPSDLLYLGQHVAGRFLIERRIGHGSFGVVYQGIDSLTGDRVALKSPCGESAWQLEDAALLLRQESNILRELHGKGVPQFIALVEDNGQVPILVMEYVNGSSLRSILSTGAMSLDSAVACAALLSESVHQLHRLGFIHRDIKPENVIIRANGCPCLVDFGLGATDDDLTIEKDEIAGTRIYMAPECLEGLTHFLDQRADIWSLGALLYEMLSGSMLHREATRSDLVREACSRDQFDSTFLPTVPLNLRIICHRCLRVNRNLRFSTAQEVGAKLRSWWWRLPHDLIPNTEDALSGWRLGSKFGGCIEQYSHFVGLVEKAVQLEKTENKEYLRFSREALTSGCDLVGELSDLSEELHVIELQACLPSLSFEPKLFQLYRQSEREEIDIRWLHGKLRSVAIHLGEVEKMITDHLYQRSSSGSENFEFAVSARISQMDSSRLDRTIETTSSRGDPKFVDFKKSLDSGISFEEVWIELDKSVERFWLYEFELLNEPERNPFSDENPFF